MKDNLHADEEVEFKNGRAVPSQSLMQKTSKIITAIVAVIIVLVILGNCVYSVSETQAAVVTTFGKAELNPNKGIQLKIPFIQEVTLVDTTVRGITIGYALDDLGNSYSIDSESVMITSDYNFLDVDFYVSYSVTDPIKFLYASNNPEQILKNIAMTSIRSTLSAYSVDSALTTGKGEIQSNIRQMIIAKLEEQDIGISLNDALVQDVEPPTTAVADAFKAVETAKQNKESSINEANQYRNEQIPAAEAEKDAILQKAEADKTARINEATGQVGRFNEEYEQYKNYPLITRQRMFYEAMEEILPGMKVIIDNGNGDIKKYYPVETFATFSNDGFKKEAE